MGITYAIGLTNKEEVIFFKGCSKGLQEDLWENLWWLEDTGVAIGMKNQWILLWMLKEYENRRIN